MAWRTSQEHSSLHPRYQDYLLASAKGISTRLGGVSATSHAIVINFGPSWPSPEASTTFGNSILELKNAAWERPPGLGLCALDTLFAACAFIQRWLLLESDHVAVSKT